MKSITSLLLLTAALGLSATSSHAGNPQRGLEISATCASCHGRNGDESLQPDYPILAGQHEDYLVYALESYRDGRRQNAIMNGFAQNLTDRDIADLAAWYASQDGLFDIDIK